ncbi:class IV adenylate cyclase [Halobaculum magnesiiphilum]|uniref:Class IV adenylate cyclase n=1 Tax=Halobaculum magnesiiphilum TaxID=1017351 RepID=A0A8T8WEX4_9EURY|nr:class IV adenylate cyclase [Halobaculum magnesiiphilum]QZP38381.1 class IV adenylate cyclase [Halobaculum magnesiiphilum]
MYEVEVKVRADLDAVRDRLADLDATGTRRVRQVDTYYDAPHRDFAETDEALRIRRETVAGGANDDGGGAATKVTYKGPLVEAESKTREEFETAVADGDAAEGILGGLGFSPAATVEKDREFFELDGYTVTLDNVAGVGEFVEVEREAVEPEIESAREGAYVVLRDLGLDPDDQIRTSYLGLLLRSQDMPNDTPE